MDKVFRAKPGNFKHISINNFSFPGSIWLLWIFIFTFCSGCIERYEFLVKNNKPTLVVEGYISNVSYNESLAYPSEGRFFTVKLRLTSDVTNTRDEVVTTASVNIISEAGEKWMLISTAPGTYTLEDKNFKAVEGQAYKLQIILTDGETYESTWQRIEQLAVPPMGNIGFEEVEKQVYEMKAGEEVVQTIKGINVYIDVPANETGKPLFYRWDFTPTWIYIAPLASSYDPTYRCWVTNKNYLSDYALQIDNVGAYRKNLFFVKVDKNERIYEGLSVLIKQYAMSEDYYYFWKEMQEQVESEGLFDTPPFNLQTNIKSLNGDEKVSGYFGVVDEKAQRWNFNITDLSYGVVNTLPTDCIINAGPGGPPPACTSCLQYDHGEVTNVKPAWWGQE